MAWFNHNKKPRGETEDSHDKRVEVVVHQNATKEAVKQAQEANKHLGNLLEENGFTIKIWVAAGGKTKKAGT
jgi:hypothetical protein